MARKFENCTNKNCAKILNFHEKSDNFTNPDLCPKFAYLTKFSNTQKQ